MDISQPSLGTCCSSKPLSCMGYSFPVPVFPFLPKNHEMSDKSACNLLIKQLYHPPSMTFAVQTTQFGQRPASGYFLFFSVSPWWSGATWDMQTNKKSAHTFPQLSFGVHQKSTAVNLPSLADLRIIHPDEQFQDSVCGGE